MALTPAELAQADDIFKKLISHCEPLQSSQPYKKVTLVRLKYEHSRSKHSFLRHFYDFLDTQSDQGPPCLARGLSKFSTFGSAAPAPALQEKEAEGAIDSFADYLFDNFFLPLKVSWGRTPQLTPASLSAPSIEDAVGTPARLSTLWRDCLIRGRNRCVATRRFNFNEAMERSDKDPDPTDDDGQQLIFARDSLASLKFSHIIPRSIMSATVTVGGELQLSESKKTTHAILNMFDPGVIHLIEGPNIDRAANTLTLTVEAHMCFGDFRFSFEAMDDSVHPPHTYKIHSLASRVVSLTLGLPVTRTLLLSPNHTIDPPSSRLLAIHRAIAVILHLSAAGEHIDRVIRSMEEIWVRSDGSAELGHVVSLRLGGWLDGVAT